MHSFRSLSEAGWWGRLKAINVLIPTSWYGLAVWSWVGVDSQSLSQLNERTEWKHLLSAVVLQRGPTRVSFDSSVALLPSYTSGTLIVCLSLVRCGSHFSAFHVFLLNLPKSWFLICVNHQFWSFSDFCRNALFMKKMKWNCKTCRKVKVFLDTQNCRTLTLLFSTKKSAIERV